MPIYDTGLVILLVHADATYLVAYRAVWRIRVWVNDGFNDSPTPY